MTPADYASELFRYATGWLGWTPPVALGASIFHIELALDGRVDFLRSTSPWGAAAEENPTEKAAVAGQLASALRAMGAKRNG